MSYMDHPDHDITGKSAVYKWFVATVNVFFILSLISVYQWVMHGLQFKANTTDWSLFEILTNYEAGFIRRGLLGQILYWVASNTHIDLRILIPAFFFPFWIFVAVFMIRKFWKSGVRWWLLAIIGIGLLGSVIRKDFFIYTIFIAILYIYRSRYSVTLRVTAMSLLSLIMLLAYEPAMFMCLGFVVLLVLRDKTLPISARAAYPGVLCITMFVLLKSTGITGVGQSILYSWQDMIPDEFAFSDTVINSLDWKISDSISFNLNKLMPQFNLFFLLKYIFIILLTPYLYINYMYVDTYPGERKFSCNPSVFTTLFAFFMLCMLPMWIGLSCDYGRMLYHATLSSLCVAFILPQQKTESAFPLRSLKIGEAIYRLCRRIPRSIYSITILMLLITPSYSFGYTPEYHLKGDSLFVRVMIDALDMVRIILSHIF